MSLRLIEHNYQSGTPVDSSPCPTPSEMTLITLPARWQLETQPFNFSEYFEHLHTTSLGRTLLYTAVIPSTQTLFTGNIEFCNALTADMGVVSVAGQQTKGKGESLLIMCIYTTCTTLCGRLNLHIYMYTLIPSFPMQQRDSSAYNLVHIIEKMIGGIYMTFY